MDPNMGDAVGVIDRVSRSIAIGDVAMRDGDVTAEAQRLLRSEAPWLGDDAVGSVVNNILGFGPVQPLLDDHEVTDVLINGAFEIWVDRGGDLELTDRKFASHEDLVAAVERAIAPLGLRIDRAAPMVSARLSDGSRLHAVLPPASVDIPLVAIRRFTQRIDSMESLVATGTATKAQAETMRSAVEGRATLVVSGGTGVGKTTLVNLLAGLIPSSERVITIEDAAELSLGGHVVRLEARTANAEGVGEISVRSLLRSALRMRPDRIIVGEVRGAEALDLISALNTGHRGSLTTVHANSPIEALWRLETLAMTAGEVDVGAVRRQLWASVDLIVQLDRVEGGRRVTEIVATDDLKAESWN